MIDGDVLSCQSDRDFIRTEGISPSQSYLAAQRPLSWQTRTLQHHSLKSPLYLPRTTEKLAYLLSKRPSVRSVGRCWPFAVCNRYVVVATRGHDKRGRAANFPPIMASVMPYQRRPCRLKCLHLALPRGRGQSALDRTATDKDGSRAKYHLYCTALSGRARVSFQTVATGVWKEKSLRRGEGSDRLPHEQHR